MVSKILKKSSWILETCPPPPVFDILHCPLCFSAASIVYTVKGYEGHILYLPCQLPRSNPVQANTVWFKDTDSGAQTELNFAYDSTVEPRVELLYPGDHDQTVIMRNLVMEDAGIYRCKSAEGAQLSTVQVLIEGGSGSHQYQASWYEKLSALWICFLSTFNSRHLLSVRPTTQTFSCESYASAWEPCQDGNSRTAGPILQESIVEFSMNAFSHLRESQPAGNLLFSPISISALLTHLLLGMKPTPHVIMINSLLPGNHSCTVLDWRPLMKLILSGVS